MLPTQKKGVRGRPPKSRRDAQRAAEERKADGDRLRLALEQLSLTQYEAAERSGVPQGHISSIVNGDRALYRDELRRFGRIGISADYLLGLTDELSAPGLSRTAHALEEDIARAVAAEMEVRHPAPKLGRNQFRWAADGAAILASLFDSMAVIAKESSARRQASHLEMEAAIAIKRAGARLKEMGETDPELQRATERPWGSILKHIRRNMTDRQPPTQRVPVLLEYEDSPFTITYPTEGPGASLWAEEQKRTWHHAPPAGSL